MTNNYDRRVIRTKKEIKETFISLLEEKNFEKISVRDLTERAGINRGTFYLHYLDKYDLLDKLEGELFAKIQAIIDELPFTNHPDMEGFAKDRLVFIIRLLECFREEADFMKVILSANGDAHFKEKIREVFVYNIEDVFSKASEENQMHYPLELYYAYSSSAHLGVLTYWLQTDSKEPPEMIANMLLDIILKGPLAAIGLDRYFYGSSGDSFIK